ncbi:MAG: hypothetical protein KGZ37_07640 [Nitrosarchaeum sp.]|nr:hypothetical protein [Nitrosarchaeum sp.]
MKNIILFGFLAFAITGLLTPSILSDSFASPEDAPGRDQGTKTASGCDKGTAKNNPNCNGSSTPNPCSGDDGIITSTELAIYLGWTESEATALITIAEINAGTKSNLNNQIDNSFELRQLNNILPNGFPC